MEREEWQAALDADSSQAAGRSKRPVLDCSDVGVAEGEICNRDGCKGVIEARETEGCSCHINPPCAQCVDPKEYCDTCGWDATEE